MVAAPLISTVSVAAALETLLYSTTATPDAKPLYALTVVDEFLDDPALPAAVTAREFALSIILTELITNELTAQRAVAGLPPPAAGCSRAAASVDITRDARQKAPELLAWSLLYHTYARPDLNLTQRDFCALAAVETRTLYRYRQHGLKRLTQRLMAVEWQARRRYRHRQMLAQIPQQDAQPFIGRQDILARLEADLRQGHIVGISGLPGSGKSALLRQVVRGWIAADALDDLLWIEQPASLKAIYQRLQRWLVPAGSRLSVAAVMQARQVMIVIDGLESLGDIAAPDWRQLLALLSHARTLIAGQRLLATEAPCTHYRLTGLNAAEASAFVQQHLQQRRLDVTAAEDYAGSLRALTDGNPAAMRLALAHLEQDNHDFFHGPVLASMYEALYARCTPDVQQVWRLLAVLSPVSAGHLYSLPPVAARAMPRLLALALLDYLPDSGEYRLMTSAAQYIAQGCQAVPPMLAALHEDVALCLAHFGAPPLWWLARLADTAWLPLPPALVQDWLQQRQDWQQLIQLEPERGLDVFRRYPPDRFETRLLYAICLRKSGDMLAAAPLFQALLAEAGQAGHFEQQTAVMVEYAIAARLVGAYQTALEQLERAQRLARHYRQAALAQRITAEMLQIAIDTQDAARAGDYLRHLDEDETNTALLILRMELYLLLNQMPACRQLARTLEAASLSLLDRGLVQTIIGRSYEAQPHPAAITAFENAVQFFERAGDVYALARAQSNLAALLIQTGDYDDAGQFLAAAAQTQQRLQDVIGLSVTRLNQQTLDRQRLT
ncbi:MAG: hypothetical protein MUE40_08795 [Anaerolineae bacterium]|nr:hypothetical protein [Anaerolineae bacterium]